MQLYWCTIPQIFGVKTCTIPRMFRGKICTERKIGRSEKYSERKIYIMSLCWMASNLMNDANMPRIQFLEMDKGGI